MRKPIILLLGALIVASLSAIGFLALESGGGPSDNASPRSAAVTSPTPSAGTATATPAQTDPAPTPAGEVGPQGIEVARLVLPSLEIDAPIITLGVDESGTMESPDNPVDVAWYSFSALPGEGSNVVMAGHLDYVNYGPAVFYRLNEAAAGAEVELHLIDGSTALYRVLDVTTYDEATAPVQRIVGPTDREIVTLITCGGAFDPLAREYNKRVVLRAERVLDSAIGN